jgi:hypothetical protein
MLSSPVYLEGHSRRLVFSTPRDLCGLSVGVYPEPSRRALDCSFFVFSGRSNVQRSDVQTFLSPLECALPTKHRVLPVFSRNRQPSSYLDATLTSILVSIDSKQLTREAKSFRCNTYKKTRGQGRALFFLDAQTLGRSDVPTCFPQSHCSAKPLVPQSAKAREFFAIRGNNSAPPGV